MIDDAVALAAARARAARTGGFWGDRTLLDAFEHNRCNAPDRVAISGFNSTRGEAFRLTTAELADLVDRLAAGLHARGVARTDVVSAQLPNWWQMIALHLAALRLGAVFNPLMPIFRERELSFMLAFAESKVLIVPERFRDHPHGRMALALQSGLPSLEHVLVIGAEGAGSFEKMLQESLPAPPRHRTAPDDVIQLLYTSGTTGEPKGVMHTSNTLLANLSQFNRIQRLGPDDVTLMASPLAHQTGFLYGLMNPILLGGRVVMQDIWNPKQAVEIIGREGVSFSIGATPFLVDLLQAATGQPQALRTLRLFVAAGAPIPRHLVGRAASEFGVAVCSMWGMSENGPAAFTRPGDPLAKTLETDGCAAPGMELRIVDAAGAPCAHGTEGRLLVRGAGMFVGYLRRPELGATDGEGWYDTGDLGRMDDDGYVRISGRSKDVVIRGGENIPVVEIEGLMLQHPAIAEAAIVAMPDPRLNERACAFVALRTGQVLTLAELSTFLLSHGSSKSYLPERLEIVEALPKTPTGKIQKFKLREEARRFGKDA